jgi:hypothetical protein
MKDLLRHAGANIHLRSLAGGTCRGAGRHNWPGDPLEQAKQLFGNEARPGGIETTIALRVPAVDEEALRHDQMKVVLCAGHGDIEQATLFLDLRRGASTEIGGHAAVNHIEQIDAMALAGKACSLSLGFFAL